MTSEINGNTRPNFRPGSKADMFLRLADPDELGFSRQVTVEEFVGEYEILRFGNGGDWIRQDGSLARYYNIRRHPQGRGKITHVELQGYRKVVIQKPIPDNIRSLMSSRRCVVLDTGNPQCDHKDGRLDDPRLSDVNLVTESDFQPLSQAANNAKRQHCQVCRDTGKRFDAKTLGYLVGQVRGNGDYNGTCVGCYWHDPLFFNGEISKNYDVRNN